MLRNSVVAIIATLAIWFSVAMVDVITGGTGWALDLAVFVAFCASVSLWLVLAFMIYDSRAPAPREKSKHAESDQRLALLLALMDEPQKNALRERLMDELSADGEAVSLAEILASQEEQTRHESTRALR